MEISGYKDKILMHWIVTGILVVSTAFVRSAVMPFYRL